MRRLKNHIPVRTWIIALAILLLLLTCNSNQYAQAQIKTASMYQLDTLQTTISVNYELARIASYNKFLDTIGFKESRNQYDVVNTIGCLGRYQFKLSTLHGLGFNCTAEEYLVDTILQEESMVAYLSYHQNLLHDVIEAYNGTVFNDIYVTESGILAAAHLAGAGGVRGYFNGYGDVSDAYGTRLTNYLENYSGYVILENKYNEE